MLSRLRRPRRIAPRTRVAALVMGAGTSGQAMVRALRRDSGAGLAPIGFLDDNSLIYRVCGLPVLGRLDQIGEVAAGKGAQVVVLAIPSLPRPRLADLVERSWRAGLVVRALPPGGRTVQDLREMRLSWLLGRDEVAVAGGRARHLVTDKRVLITGAGGVLGSALCHRLARLNPAALCLVDHDPRELHRLRVELGDAGLLSDDRIVATRADVQDRGGITRVFGEVRPELVFHAAQYRRPPALERDPCAGVLSNVRGTQHVVDAAVGCQVKRLAFVSTDKAADPTSVFGATKRLAELVLQARAGGPTRFAAVRIGDLIGPPGSLLSSLAARIAKNETITITHPDVARNFMTVDEAAGLVLEATALAEEAETFVLDVGDPVPVVELVHRYAEQLRIPQVTIRFSGLRPGDKLAEKVFSAGERRIPTAHPNVSATRPAPLPAGLCRQLEALYLAAEHGDEGATRTMLRRLLPEYQPVRRPETPTAGVPEVPGLEVIA